MPRPHNLTINSTSATEAARTSNGPNSSPIHLEGVDLSSFGGDFPGPANLTSLPPLPSSPQSSPRHNREPSKGILKSFRNRPEPDHEPRRGGQTRQVKDEDDTGRTGSLAQMYTLKHRTGSTPELSLISADSVTGKPTTDANNNNAIPNSRPQPSPHHSEDSTTSSRRREKQAGFRNPLTRSKSLRRDSHSKSRPEPPPPAEQAPRNAPLPLERPNDMLKTKGKEKRGKSSERSVVSESDENVAEARNHAHAKEKDKEIQSQKSGFMSGSKNVVSKTTKASGSFLTRLGKIGRSSSNNEKEVSDSEYVPKVINLPLVEQTRVTRISKDLSSCRDKTEYWMPSLPWRCIDYLNLNCESEGLYRVPGSGPQVKRWQRRFDTELDVDLLDESDLFDPNNIGSMLKAWLRDQPTEIMPATLQNNLALELEKENPDYARMGQPAPQKLRDALSELSPFNYYLLFAITCHLSLLLSHKEKNRMDLNNLCICIGPCLKLERWLFNYLVGDWRHCWQGCFTEKQYLEAEKAHEQGLEYQMPPTNKSSANLSNGNAPPSSQESDERVVYSSASSEPTSHSEDARPTPTPSDDGRSRRRREKSKPDSFRPIAPRELSNGVSTPQRSPTVAETKRPATAEDASRKGSEDTPSRSTPRQYSHGRSKSDVPTTPVQSSEFVLPPLPLRPGAAS